MMDHIKVFAYATVATFFIILMSVVVASPFLIGFAYFVSGLPK